jgi:hypothetical protein
MVSRETLIGEHARLSEQLTAAGDRMGKAQEDFGKAKAEANALVGAIQEIKRLVEMADAAKTDSASADHNRAVNNDSGPSGDADPNTRTD